MRTLLDEGIPTRTAVLLRQQGVDASHLVELGMLGVDDVVVLDRAVKERAIIVTLDSDFHQLLALSGGLQPSVIRIRIEGLRFDAMAERILNVIESARIELTQGAAVSVDKQSIRIHELPLTQ